MNARSPFVFIHPDTGIETIERRGECARLLHALLNQDGRWIEAFELGMVLRSDEVKARMSNIKEAHGPNLIHKREGRKGLSGRWHKEYRINPAVRVIEQP